MDTGSHGSRKWQNLGLKKLPKKYQFVVIWRSGRASLYNYVGKRPWYKQSPSKIRRTFLQANKCPAYLFHPRFINIVTL